MIPWNIGIVLVEVKLTKKVFWGWQIGFEIRVLAIFVKLHQQNVNILPKSQLVPVGL